MTVFKSKGSMRLDGESARRWAKKIGVEKPQQEERKGKKNDKKTTTE